VSQVSFAVILPNIVAFLLAPYVGVHGDPKYLTQLKPACALAAALPIGFAASALLARMFGERLRRLVEGATPFAAAAVIAIAPPLTPVDADRAPTVGDLSAVARVLEEHRWSTIEMLQGFMTAARVPALTGLLQLTSHSDATPALGSPRETAILLSIDADDLPQPLPADWKIVRRSAQSATVLIVQRSRLDWSRCEVCSRQGGASDEHCAAATWPSSDVGARDLTMALPQMPPAGGQWIGMLRLRLPLRIDPNGATGAIFMPRVSDSCGGRIGAVGADDAQISSDGRYATFSVSGPGVPEAELQWDIGSNDCIAGMYQGLPPFVIEGDAVNVHLLATILRKEEG
jgi:hypothetical protein